MSSAQRMRHEMLLKKKDVFEVKEKDLLGRIGKLHTKNGILDTPYLFPVVHPVNHVVLPKEIHDIGYQAVMTNAFLARKAFGSSPGKKIHERDRRDYVVDTHLASPPGLDE